jgi:Ca-activated chloride channel homolog
VSSTPVIFAGWKQAMDGLSFAPGSNMSVQQIIECASQSNSDATVYFAFLDCFVGNPPGPEHESSSRCSTV